jgi:hypothetical protein
MATIGCNGCRTIETGYRTELIILKVIASLKQVINVSKHKIKVNAFLSVGS